MRIRGEDLTIKRVFGFIKRCILVRRKMLIFKMDINDAPDRIECKANVEISQFRTANLDQLIRDKRPQFKATILERIGNGDLCFVAKRNNIIWGYQWQRHKSYYFPEVDYEIEMDDHSVWMYGGHVFEEERGKRILHELFLEQFRYCKDLGYKWVYAGILSNNIPSLRSCNRFGFTKVVKEIKMTRFLGIKKITVTDYVDEDYE